MQRFLEIVLAIGLGFIAGALAQAASELNKDHTRNEYCTPLYDQPGVERVQCDPAGH